MMEHIRIADKPVLSIKEICALYGIGEHKVREITASDDCDFVLYVGRKRLIKRKQFDEFLKDALYI